MTLPFSTPILEAGLIDQRFKDIWEKLMLLLDENKVSKAEAVLLSDMLYSISAKKEEAELLGAGNYKSSFREDYGFENIPYLRSRWGLDPSLIKDDN
jgi:hypothetical protein